MSINVFFTSDSHYGHSNIAGPKVSSWNSGYRNFNSTHDMNEALVDSFNEAGANDIIYHLGDWSFGGKHNIETFRKSIRCQNIFLVTGNHDKHVYDHRHLFKWIKPVWEGKIHDTYFYLHHYAQRIWNMSHRGSIMLYGHSHGSLPDDPDLLSIDVGWDTELYGHEKHTLYHYDEVMSIMKQKKWTAVDHHNTNTTE
jgi:calcineurin-like phosphoesterase family protein